MLAAVGSIPRALAERSEGHCEACAQPLDPSEAFVNNGSGPPLVVCPDCEQDLWRTALQSSPKPLRATEAERPNPFEVCRMILARARREGQPFDGVWLTAVDAAAPVFERQRFTSSAAQNREAERAALLANEDQWRAGYERRSLPPRRWITASLEAAAEFAKRPSGR
jgi:hypothetical protein